jgi:hypothetical protein
LGSESKTGKGNWKLEAHNLWYTEGVKKNPEMVFHNGFGSRRRPGKRSLNLMWDWWYDSIRYRVYYYLNENPGIHEIELPARNGIGFSSVDHIVVRNIEIAYAYYGIGLWGGNDWRIDNVYVHDITTCAVQGNKASKSVVIQNSLIKDWNWRGYKASQNDGDALKGYGIQVLSSTWGESSDNWIITYNSLIIENMESGEDTCAINIDQQGHAARISKNTIRGNNSGSGIMFWRPKGNTPVAITDNSISNVAHMGINVSELDVNNFSSDILIERNVISSTCARDAFDQEALRIWPNNNASITIRNNLINGTVSGINRHHGIRIRQSPDVKAYNNTIFGTDIGISIEKNSSVILTNNISSGNRIAAISLDNSSSCKENHNNFFGEIYGISPSPTTIFSDPKFIDPFSGNFNLQPDSPAIDAGGYLFEQFYDLNGVLRSKETKGDIGAFEFINGKLIGRPKNLKIMIN